MKKFLYTAVLALASMMPQNAAADWSDYVIVLDPGHGGDDPGAVYNGSSVDNHTEAWLVLQCATNVYNELSSLGAEVHMTRWVNDFDGEINLSPRRAYCYTYGSDVFVSFHLNAANASAHGTETWYYYDGSYNLATSVQNGLISKFGEVDGDGGYDMINRGVKNNGWTVITAGNAYPAVLTEGLFVDCYSDWQLIQDTTSKGFYSWVDGHLKGIYDYLSDYGYYSVTEPTYYNGGGGSHVEDTPYISVSNNEVYFECEAGKTETATVELKGNKLNGWCFVTPSAACEGVFSVTPSGLAVDGYPNYNFVDEKPTVTITFTPKEVGEYSGDNDGDGYSDYVITLKSVDTDGNDVYQWITLNGTATAPPLSFNEKWNFSDKKNTLTQMGWDASKVRNMAYYNGKLYLVYEQSYIKVVDARTGKFLYDLNSEGVQGGLVNLADVRPFDGKIVGCNIAGVDGSGVAHDLKIYVWENSTSAPKVTTISYETLKANNIVRLGDYIEVGGDWNTIDGSRIIFAYDNYGKIDGVTGGTHIVEFPVSHGEIGVEPSKIIEVTSNGSYLPAKSSVRAYPTAYGYMINGSGIPATKIDANGNKLDGMSGYKTWGNAYRQFVYGGTTYALMLDFNDMQYSTKDASGLPAQNEADKLLNYTGGHMKLLQIDSKDWTYTFFAPKNIASYPAETLSDTRRNLNCTGNVQLNQDGDNYVEAWVLSTNQGIAYYYTGTVPGDEDGEPSIAVSDNSLSFETTVGETAAKTLNVVGNNLKGNISVSLSGDDSEMWSVSADELTESGKLVVTYEPTEAGNHSAVLTLSTEGVKDIAVSLSGNAAGKEVIVGYELTQDWEHTDNHIAAGNARWATAFNGNIYFNDKANSKLYSWSESGLKDLNISSTAGTAITSDAAGNIILSTSMYGGGNTAMKVLAAGDTEFKDLTLSLPAGVSAGGMQYMGKAAGNVMGSEGGALYLFPTGATKVAKIIVSNGVQKSATAIDVTELTADAQSIAVPLTDDIESEEIAVRVRAKNYFYTNLSGSFAPCDKTSINTTQGGTIFKWGSDYYTVEPIGTAYCDGFQVVNLHTGDVGATHNEEFGTPATKPNANCITAEVVNHTTVNLYQFVPGQLAAKYTLTAKVSSGIENVSAEAVDMTMAINGDVLSISGVEATQIDVYSVAGMYVASQSNSQQVFIGGLSHGFYLVKVVDNNGTIHTAKFVK